MEGIVNFLKPAGMTSHDAISFFRRLTGIKKIGHTGTLDPMAVGVLPICIGKTTRLIEYLEGDKSYRSIMKLGIRSKTLDIWDPDLDYEILKTLKIENYPSKTDVDKCLQGFLGDIVQRIPSYSAQKHEGKKLYEYARKGQEVPIKEKKVYINSVTVNSCKQQENEIMFDIECSKGTYVRAICADLGDKLGTGAVMSFLLRTKASGLIINDSITEEELINEKKTNGNISKYLQKPDDLLNVDKITINPKEAAKFSNGLRVKANTKIGKIYAVFSCDDSSSITNQTLIGMGIGEENKIKPEKVLISKQ